ncbi:COBRA-like protein 4 [Cucurbita argyrosperma subsp. argyrosperma]|nr:COBRA-like protein 4 [Cucurbita argyrosperma subsp. argyrosperma]
MEVNTYSDLSHKILFQMECYSARQKRVVLLALLIFATFYSTGAYDPLDPNGNITIKWDVVSWTPDGYVAVVTMNNFQMYRHINAPGWTLGWSWAKKEVIWSMVGAQTTEQGDCSKFKGNVPHCCKKTPIVVDLLPGVPYNQQFSNCCKGGVLASWGQDPVGSVSAFQVSVGLAGTSNKTVKLPKNFTLLGPGPGYTCGPAKVVPSTVFLTPDRRRKTQALSKLVANFMLCSFQIKLLKLIYAASDAVTWNVTCTYSQFLASKNPTCCVSLSTFYNDTITSCPTCACGCQNKHNCIKSNSKLLHKDGINTPKKDNTPLLQCTHHMCPVRVHWHVKINYKDYWRVKVAVTNFNYRMNYTLWTLAVQHPNLNNVTQVFSFDYKPLVPYESINDTGMFYGMKFYNDLLMEAGPFGNVQSEVLMKKDKDTFTFKQGWAFPRKVYFNGDECQMPPPESYPYLPNSAPEGSSAVSKLTTSLLLIIWLLW